MTAEIRWIRGAARRPRYVGVGRAWSLYRAIDDLQGSRALLERAALPSIGRLGRPSPVRDVAVNEAWDRLSRTVPDITSSLLIFTGFYKDTVLSGVVEAGERLFVKVFAESTGHEGEGARLRELGEIVPSGVVLARIRFEGDGVIGYELLERSRRRPSDRQLEDVAIELGMNSYRKASLSGHQASRALGETVETTLELLVEFGALISNQTATKLRGLAPSHAIAHGDFTPWNTFCTKGNRLAVVDYERVGSRAPFSDAWHLSTQAQALRGHISFPTELLTRVRNAAECDDQTVLSWYCAYLLEELNQDATDWVVRGRNHPQLRDLIFSKSRMLESSIAEVESL